MTITIEKTGRRYYLRGNTYAIKSELRDAGCKWDADAKCWWTGKRDVAERFSGEREAPAPREEDSDDITVVGRGSYKGRRYYIRWMGMTRRGAEAARLVTLDGKIDFWADLADVTILKRYASHERNGSLQPMTLGVLRRFIADKKQADDGDCPRCKSREARGLQSPYCGSGDYDECPVCGCTYRVR